MAEAATVAKVCQNIVNIYYDVYAALNPTVDLLISIHLQLHLKKKKKVKLCFLG